MEFLKPRKKSAQELQIVICLWFRLKHQMHQNIIVSKDNQEVLYIYHSNTKISNKSLICCPYISKRSNGEDKLSYQL